MKIEWSADALADLDRFAAFLNSHFPSLAGVVAREIIRKADLLSQSPLMGNSIAGRTEYRQIVLRVLNASYVLQYRVGRDRIVILRVYHGREARE